MCLFSAASLRWPHWLKGNHVLSDGMFLFWSLALQEMDWDFRKPPNNKGVTLWNPIITFRSNYSRRSCEVWRTFHIAALSVQKTFHLKHFCSRVHCAWVLLEMPVWAQLDRDFSGNQPKYHPLSCCVRVLCTTLIKSNQTHPKFFCFNSTKFLYYAQFPSCTLSLFRFPKRKRLALIYLWRKLNLK